MASEDHSLTNRILHAVAKSDENLPEFPDDDAGSDYNFDGDMEEVEEVEEITESDLLHFLDSQRDPLAIAQGLFKLDPNMTDMPAGLACLKREHVMELFNRGWTVLDGVVGEEIVNRAQQESLGFLQRGSMTPASDMKKNDPDDPFRDGTARDDLTMWLHPGQVPTPGLSALARFLSVTLKSDLHRLLHLANETEYQLAYYPPNGARYERHRDAFPTDDPADTQQRRVTSIVYLNPGWIKGDGGELRLFARPAEADGSDVDIEPVAGRLAVFLSGVVDHAVIESGKQRFAITAWHR